MITDLNLNVLCAQIVKRFVKETRKWLEAWVETHWGVEFLCVQHIGGLQLKSHSLSKRQIEHDRFRRLTKS